MTKIQKKILQEKLLKLIHFISYIFSILFIILCIFAGVSSCHRTNKSNNSSLLTAQVNNMALQLYNNKSYILKYEDIDQTIDQAILQNTQKELTNIGYSLQSYDLLNEIITVKYDITLLTNDYLEYSEFNVSLCFDFKYLGLGTTNTSLRFYSLRYEFISSYDGHIGQFTIIYKVDEVANNRTYHFNDLSQYIIYAELPNLPLLNYSFDVKEIRPFTFNNQINFNSPMALTLNNLYGNASFDTSNPDFNWKEYNVGWFTSNGQLFDTIRWTCQKTNGLTFNYDGTWQNAPSSFDSYLWLSYINSVTNDIVIVNTRDTVSIKFNSGYTNGTLNTSTWVNQNYRYINFLTIDNFTFESIENFNNNNQFVSSGSVTGSGNDAFSLLGYAFSQLLPFFSVMILPSISIGVLLFLPLVVSIVFTIIKMLHK